MSVEAVVASRLLISILLTFSTYIQTLITTILLALLYAPFRDRLDGDSSLEVKIRTGCQCDFASYPCEQSSHVKPSDLHAQL